MTRKLNPQSDLDSEECYFKPKHTESNACTCAPRAAGALETSAPASAAGTFRRGAAARAAARRGVLRVRGVLPTAFRALGNWAARGRAQARHRPPCPHRGGQLSGVEFPLVSVVLLRSCRRKRTWRVPAPSPLSPFLGGAPSPTPQATPEPALMTQVMKDLG